MSWSETHILEATKRTKEVLHKALSRLISDESYFSRYFYYREKIRGKYGGGGDSAGADITHPVAECMREYYYYQGV